MTIPFGGRAPRRSHVQHAPMRRRALHVRQTPTTPFPRTPPTPGLCYRPRCPVHVLRLGVVVKDGEAHPRDRVRQDVPVPSVRRSINIGGGQTEPVCVSSRTPYVPLHPTRARPHAFTHRHSTGGCMGQQRVHISKHQGTKPVEVWRQELPSTRRDRESHPTRRLFNGRVWHVPVPVCTAAVPAKRGSITHGWRQVDRGWLVWLDWLPARAMRHTPMRPSARAR